MGLNPTLDSAILLSCYHHFMAILIFQFTNFQPLCLSASLGPLALCQLGREEPGKGNTDSFVSTPVWECIRSFAEVTTSAIWEHLSVCAQRKRPCGRLVNILFTGWQTLRMHPQCLSQLHRFLQNTLCGQGLQLKDETTDCWEDLKVFLLQHLPL